MKSFQEYHRCEVNTLFRGRAPIGGRRYQAVCTRCDWAGPKRSTRDWAEEDGYAHDVTNNEPDPDTAA